MRSRGGIMRAPGREGARYTSCPPRPPARLPTCPLQCFLQVTDGLYGSMNSVLYDHATLSARSASRQLRADQLPAAAAPVDLAAPPPVLHCLASVQPAVSSPALLLNSTYLPCRVQAAAV